MRLHPRNLSITAGHGFAFIGVDRQWCERENDSLSLFSGEFVRSPKRPSSSRPSQSTPWCRSSPR